MVKQAGVVAWLGGIAALVVLTIWSGLDAVGHAIASVGWGILLVVMVRAVTVSVAGAGWWLLFPSKVRPQFGACLLVRFVREAVNVLLPVAQVGGAFQLHRQQRRAYGRLGGRRRGSIDRVRVHGAPREHRRSARHRKSAACCSWSGICHPRRTRGAGRRARRVVRGIRNSTGTGDCAVARQACRRCRARSAWPFGLADAGMGTLAAELPQATGTRARQSPFVKPLSRAMILFWSSVAASVVALVGCGYLVTAAILVGRLARNRASVCPAPAPGVTVLKPLHGDEPGLFDNLTSFCVQNYPGPMQIVCGVQDS